MRESYASAEMQSVYSIQEEQYVFMFVGVCVLICIRMFVSNVVYMNM